MEMRFSSFARVALLWVVAVSLAGLAITVLVLVNQGRSGQKMSSSSVSVKAGEQWYLYAKAPAGGLPPDDELVANVKVKLNNLPIEGVPAVGRYRYDRDFSTISLAYFEVPADGVLSADPDFLDSTQFVFAKLDVFLFLLLLGVASIFIKILFASLLVLGIMMIYDLLRKRLPHRSKAEAA